MNQITVLFMQLVSIAQSTDFFFGCCCECSQFEISFWIGEITDSFFFKLPSTTASKQQILTSMIWGRKAWLFDPNGVINIPRFLYSRCCDKFLLFYQYDTFSCSSHISICIVYIYMCHKRIFICFYVVFFPILHHIYRIQQITTYKHIHT